MVESNAVSETATARHARFSARLEELKRMAEISPAVTGAAEPADEAAGLRRKRLQELQPTAETSPADADAAAPTHEPAAEVEATAAAPGAGIALAVDAGGLPLAQEPAAVGTVPAPAAGTDLPGVGGGGDGGGGDVSGGGSDGGGGDGGGSGSSGGSGVVGRLARFMNAVTFSELSPLLSLATKNKRLEVADLPPLEERATCEHVLRDFGEVFSGCSTRRHPGIRFILAVSAHFRGLLLSVLALRVANDMLSFAGPLALEQILGWLVNPAQRRPWWEPAGLPLRFRGIYYVAVMSGASLVGTVFGVREQALGVTMGSQVSTWARAEIYTKALRQKTHVRAAVTSGQVVNLMSMDAGFLRQIPRLIPRIPRAIVKAGVGIALLSRLMGRASTAAGVGVMLAFSPIGYLGIANLDRCADKYAVKRDKRQGQMGELLAAIKLVKLNGWEAGMRRSIGRTRREELERMWWFQIADHFCGAPEPLTSTATPLHPPLPVAGVSTAMERGRQQNDRTLADCD